jgi:hypothetical protein
MIHDFRGRLCGGHKALVLQFYQYSSVVSHQWLPKLVSKPIRQSRRLTTFAMLFAKFEKSKFDFTRKKAGPRTPIAAAEFDPVCWL